MNVEMVLLSAKIGKTLKELSEEITSARLANNYDYALELTEINENLLKSIGIAKKLERKAR